MQEINDISSLTLALYIQIRQCGSNSPCRVWTCFGIMGFSYTETLTNHAQNLKVLAEMESTHKTIPYSCQPEPHQCIQVVEFQECSTHARQDATVTCLCTDTVT